MKRKKVWIFEDKFYKKYLKIKDTITTHTHLAIDTSTFKQIDFDSSVDSKLIDEFKNILPYYESSTKKLPHFIFKDDNYNNDKNMNTPKLIGVFITIYMFIFSVNVFINLMIDEIL